MTEDDPFDSSTRIGSPAYRRRLLDGVAAEIAARRTAVIDHYSGLGMDPLRSPAVLAAVDAGGPWKEILVRETAETMGVRPPPARIVDLLAGPQRMRGGGLHNVVAIAARLPAQWLPLHHPSADSAAFLSICGELRHLADDRDLEHVPTLFVGCGGDWHRWRKHLVDKIALQAAAPADDGERDEEDDDFGPALPSLRDGMQAAFQFTLGFANQVVVPLLVRDFGRSFEEALLHGYDAARALLLNGIRLEEAMEFSKFMARRPGDFESALYDRIAPADAPTWTALTAPFAHDNGLTAVPVLSAHDAIDEGRRGMNPDGTRGLGNHAAATIVHAMEGKMHVYSIRTAGDPFRRLGTIVLSYEYDVLGDARYAICDAPQNKLARIRTPWPGIVIEAGLMGEGEDRLPPEAMRVFRKMAVAIAEGRLRLAVPPSPEMIASGEDYVDATVAAEAVVLHNDRRPDLGTSDQVAGYPISARNAVEAALEAWRPHLPRNLKKVTLDDVTGMVSMAVVDLDADRPALRP